MTRLRGNLAKARAKNGLPVAPNMPIPPLNDDNTPPPTPAYMPDVEIDEVEPEVMHHHNGNGRVSKRSGLFPWDNINMLFVLFALVMMGTGCAPDNAPPLTREVVYIGDASISPKDTALLPSIDQQVSFTFPHT